MKTHNQRRRYKGDRLNDGGLIAEESVEPGSFYFFSHGPSTIADAESVEERYRGGVGGEALT
ncbi:MAG: hypothetical protein JSR64_14665 [Nitrospira sp.]|nr:hypothetical protein [Nitrospira sp.]MCW5780317.1 hypothetical protein [Nitrospira sp.]HNK16255.1 hypothetical protein [Nitrospira sp.]